MDSILYKKKLIKENKETRKKAILKLLEKRIDNYIPSISFLTDFQIDKFLESCLDSVKHKSYSININYADQDYLNPFIFLLTKKENKENQIAKRKRNEYTITFSGNRFKKTCKQTLDLNEKLSYILNYKLLSAEKKYNLYENLANLDHDFFFGDEKIKENTLNKINEIENKLNSNKKIPIPNDLSNIVSYFKVSPKTKVTRHYKNFSKIDNTPKKNTSKNIEIYDESSNLPQKPKLKVDKNLIKEYLDRVKKVNDYSKDITSKKKKSKTKIPDPKVISPYGSNSQLETLKPKNVRKTKKSNNLKLQERLETLKKENAKKAKKLKSLKNKHDKIIKNTLKKYNKPKKSIWEVIELPKPLVI